MSLVAGAGSCRTAEARRRPSGVASESRWRRLPGHWLHSDARSFATRTTRRQQLVQLKSLPQAPPAFQALSFYRFAGRLEDEVTCRRLYFKPQSENKKQEKSGAQCRPETLSGPKLSKPPHNTCDPPLTASGGQLTFKDGRTTRDSSPATG